MLTQIILPQESSTIRYNSAIKHSDWFVADTCEGFFNREHFFFFFLLISPETTAKRSWNRWKRLVRCHPRQGWQRTAYRWCPAEVAGLGWLSRLFCKDRRNENKQPCYRNRNVDVILAVSGKSCHCIFLQHCWRMRFGSVDGNCFLIRSCHMQFVCWDYCKVSAYFLEFSNNNKIRAVALVIIVSVCFIVSQQWLIILETQIKWFCGKVKL